jgi:hypothetical protein
MTDVQTSAPDMILVHPNQYFKESRRILTGERPATAAAKPSASNPDALDVRVGGVWVPCCFVQLSVTASLSAHQPAHT